MTENSATTQPALSFAQVYEMYYPRIFQRVYRLVNHHEQAQDLTHDVFYKAYLAFPTLKSRDNLSGWLYCIATNVARDALRHRRLIAWRSLHPLAEVLEDTESAVSMSAVLSSGEVYAVLDTLPQEYRLVLLLRAQGYTNGEIAKRFGKAEGTIKNTVHRARVCFQQRYAAMHHVEVKRWKH